MRNLNSANQIFASLFFFSRIRGYHVVCLEIDMEEMSMRRWKGFIGWREFLLCIQRIIHYVPRERSHYITKELSYIRLVMDGYDYLHDFIHTHLLDPFIYVCVWTIALLCILATFQGRPEKASKLRQWHLFTQSCRSLGTQQLVRDAYQYHKVM
jgi:hypothetical protein